jgi:hypothetical protein
MTTMMVGDKKYVEALAVVAYRLNWDRYIPAADIESGPSEKDIPSVEAMDAYRTTKRQIDRTVAAGHGRMVELELWGIIRDLQEMGDDDEGGQR